MRLKLDENIDARLAVVLRNAGHDAVTVREQDLHGTDDIHLYRLCISETRTLVTLDLDFSNILRYPPESTPGLISFEAQTISLALSGF
jgi:predicted nuclease of predicted toxin-antitoxin system